MDLHEHEHPRSSDAGTQTLLRAAIAAGLLVPIFFQLDGRIFRNEGGILYDSGGLVMTVPLPVSLAVAVLGAMLLAPRYRQAAVGFTVCFLLFAGMAFTTIVTTLGTGEVESRKLLLLLQFAVPAIALCLGQMYGPGGGAFRTCAIAFLGVISAVVPLQLGYSFALETFRHHVWGFTIYQHRQFVPVIFVGAYLFAAFALWEDRRNRFWILALAPIMGAYAAASYALLALALLVGGLMVFAVVRARTSAVHLCVALTVGAAAAYLYVDREGPAFRAKYGVFLRLEPSPVKYGVLHPPPSGLSEDVVSRMGEATRQAESTPSPVPLNVRSRLADWTLYGRGIAESPWTALFGRAKPLDRAVATSAHNYYLDFIYNFGLLASLPLLWLIGYTAALLWRARGALRRDLPLLGLVVVVVFLVLIDNNLKVTFRQPYPGLFGFFLWGLLVSRLSASPRTG